MKKSTKLIALISILALVAAILAVAVFADEGQENTTVTEPAPGTYTPVQGSFDPADENWGGKYDGMIYGIWSNEIFYTAGREPDYWYQNVDSTKANYTTTLDSANIGTTDSNGAVYKDEYKNAGYVPLYVHLFANIDTQSAQIVTGSTQALTLDLGGHTLTMKNGFRVGGSSSPGHPLASLTVKNGKAVHTNGQMQLRSDTSFIVENVHWAHTAQNSQGSMYYNAQSDLIRYTDCFVELEKGVSFSFGYQEQAKGNARGQVLFENTDIVYADGITVPVLFDVYESANNTSEAAWDINFDKDSTITADAITTWFRYKENVASGEVWSKKSTINFEPGFTLSEGLTKPATYQLIASGETAEVPKNVGPDTNLEVTEHAAETVGLYTAPEGAWNPVGAGNAGNYPGITFATWADEQDYLDGKPPVAWYQNIDSSASNYTTTFTSDNIGAAGIGYVHCFEDVVNNTAGRLALPNKVYLIINLGGKTLKDDYAWTVNASSGNYPNSLFMIKNGTVVRTPASTQPTYCREDGTIIFKNVIYDASSFTASTLFNDLGCELFVFEDCLVKLRSNHQFVLAGNRAAPLNNYFIFKNTDLIQDGTPTVPLFDITQGQYGKQNWTIVFDKDSSIKRNGNNWVAIKESGGTLSYVQGLYFEAGLQITPAALPSYDMQYSYLGGTAAANSSGKFFEVAVIAPTDGGIQYTLPTPDAIPTVSGMNAPIGRTEGSFDSAAFSAKVKSEIYCSKAGFALEDIDGTELKLLVALPVWKPTGEMTYAVWADEQSYLEGSAPFFSSDGTELLTADIATLGDGVTYKAEYEGKIPGYVVLFANVGQTSAIYVGNTQNLTIDLNGSTLTSTAGFIIGNPEADARSAQLKLMGGSFVIEDGVITPADGTTATFYNLDMTVRKSGRDALLSASRGEVIYSECRINLESGSAGFLLAGGDLSFLTTSIEQFGCTAPLFWVDERDTSASVFFDKTSSIARDSTLYAGVASTVESTVHLEIFFEDGIAVSKTAVPDFTYLSSIAPTVDGVTVSVKEPNSACDIAVVTSDLSNKYTDIYFVTGAESVKLLGSMDNYVAGEVDPTNPRNFIQVWESTIDAGATKTPLTKNPGATIKLFRDAELRYGGTHLDYDLTIDLNGFTLTRSIADNFQLGIDRSGYWQPNRDVRFISSSGRGKLVLTHTGTVFQARPGANVYFENLDITFSGDMFNDGGAQLISFKNCNITSPNAGKYIISRDGLGTGGSEHLRRVVFDGTTLDGVGILKVWASVPDHSGYEVILMNGCTVDNSSPLIYVTDSIREGTVISEVVRNLYVDMDTKFTSTSTQFDKNAPIYAAPYHSLEVKYFTDITDYTSVGTPADTRYLMLLSEGEYYKVFDEREIDLSNISYAVAAPGSLKVASVTKLDGDGNAYITVSDLERLSAESVITIYRDLLLTGTGTGCGDGLVFELSGNTLTFENSFTVVGTELTFLGGTLRAPELSGELFVFNGAPTLILTDVVIEDAPSVTTLFNVGEGSLVLSDVELTAPNATVAILTGAGTASLDNVTAEAKSFLAVNYTNGTKVNVTVNGSVLNLSGAALTATASPDVYDGTSDDYINLKISASYVKGTEFIAAVSDAATAPLVHAEITESYFSVDPTVPSAIADVTLGRGERSMPITGLDGFGWHVTVFDVKLKASILIESDFGIKFYIPDGTNITVITIGGREYVIADITDKEMYDGTLYSFILLENILPTDAAEVIDITVVFTKDGVSHTEDTGYSVVDYFKTLLNSDKTLKLKELGTAALDYIAAAYSYANKTNAELDAIMASEQYALYKGEVHEAVAGEDDTAALAGVISGAQLELNAIVKIRFNLTRGYTGTLVINGRSFEIENGTYEGADYVSLSLPAFELCDVLAISADGGISGTYSLEKYAAAIADGTAPASDEEQALVAAFYNYCRYAQAFRALYEN